MDVRCERCKSEYEVEDAKVSDLGTEVQCSDCGHQFLVRRPASQATLAKPMKASRDLDGEEAGAWVIETDSGRSLRLRDLTTLHKWIIERRVGRNDRLSRGGDPWQRLGDMGELAPFFDIMDSAERARMSDTPLPASRPLPFALPTPEPPTPQLSQPQRSLLRPAPARPQAATAPAVQARAASGSLPSALYDSGAEKTVIVRLEAAKPRIFLKLLITMLVAAIVAYAGILWQQRRLPSAMVSSPGTAENLPTPAVVAQAPAPAPAPAPVPAPAENAEAAEESAESGGAPHGPVVEPIANDGPGEKIPLLGKAGKRAAANRPIPARKAKAQAKAQGAQVGSAKPNAPQSLAAQGYVALNHRQPSRAVALFKQALASNPTNGTALFGLAEAYRNAGQSSPALQSYRRYVELLPSGPDAGSARYQIRLLETKKR
jgi:predicted Zn finger-like uncharacterized protein